MGKREEIREQKSKAGKASAEKRERERQQNATPVEHLSTPVEHYPTKERKVKERKENKSEASPFVAPSVLEVQAYFKEKGYTIEAAAKAHEFYNVADWKDSNGKQVRSWKQKMNSVWFKDGNKPKNGNGTNGRLSPNQFI